MEYMNFSKVAVDLTYNLSYAARYGESFSNIDHAVFLLVSILVIGVGVYYSFLSNKVCKERKVTLPRLSVISMEKTADDEVETGATMGDTSDVFEKFTLGERGLKSFPVAMSLIATYFTTKLTVYLASEVYLSGTQSFLEIFTLPVAAFLTISLYLPVFAELKLRSPYDYLERRFGKMTRNVMAVIFLCGVIVSLPSLIYDISFIFSNVTGVNVHVVNLCTCTMGCFLASVGGVKAVIYSQIMQVFVVIMSYTCVLVKGTADVDGLKTLFNITNQGGRFIFFDTEVGNPEGSNIQNVLICTLFNNIAHTCSDPSIIQQYLTLPNLKKFRTATIWFVIGFTIIFVQLYYSGILMYAVYHKCDPFLEGYIKNPDLILPLFVTSSTKQTAGLGGFFMAAILGLDMQSLTIGLTTLGVVITADIIERIPSNKLTPKRARKTVISTIIIGAIVSFTIATVMNQIPLLVYFKFANFFVDTSINLGIFTLGIMFPWANEKGVIAGIVISIIVTASLTFAMKYSMYTSRALQRTLPLSTLDCDVPFVDIIPKYIPKGEIGIIHKEIGIPFFGMNQMWLVPIGVTIFIVVGIIVSFATNPTDVKNMNLSLISPLLRRYFLKKYSKESRKGETRRQE